MRTYLLLYSIILYLWIPMNLNAQDRPLPAEDLINPQLSLPPGVSFGVKIGANIFSPLITHNPSAVYAATPTGEFVPGFNAGMGITVNLPVKTSLFADVQFVSSTAKYLVTSGNYLDEFNEDMNQLSLPVGALYKMGSGGIKYYPMAGLVFNYLMYSDINYAYHPFPTETAYTQNGGFDISFDRNRVLLDALAGFGFQYQVKVFYLGLEITYRYGLRNFIDTKSMQPMQVYDGSSPPFRYQSPGFRTQGIMVNLVIQKPGK